MEVKSQFVREFVDLLSGVAIWTTVSSFEHAVEARAGFNKLASESL
jgi:hypothetical protein